ncbi:Molybdenum cofactor biosynthesis protein A [Peptostreptococcus anaerobius]|uniref:Molybdenum cofactor biosynthesis protein A n=1 Tax=Peptostreptococcus anaerobius TaxID=1261 RepID=A0A379CDP3_9FIRM|nr:radical SAM protein [Peptostreptococcus anaerobius]EKX94028.1 radical SAM domain protein [Peptostreptococcus anaerobius VPI 4330 = DSM 2949]SFN35799.1 radical SAM additional 4Fe4S-binding SPASM domain-containing protein [Peptostreptococcus anaerobius]SUB60318.1 Molybdenum cofactor biosynthesis protein A [Peptostreptococcus anaerobius]
MEKYFIEDFAYLDCCEKETIIANKANGMWIKVPKICYEIIKLMSENNKYISCGIEYFEREEDKKYFQNIIEKLDQIGVLSEYFDDKLYFRRVEVITISLTNRCNLYCDYCCTNARHNYKDLPTDDIKKIIKNIMSFDPKKIVITGGEPMIRKDFFEIIEYIRKDYSGEIQLLTNGTYITRDNINLLKMIDSISISIDGYNKKMVDKIRGNGTFEKVINSISFLQEIKFKKIALSMVFGENDRNKMNKFKDFCEISNVKPVYRFFSRFGRGKNLNTYIKNSNISFFPLVLFNKNEYIERTLCCNPGNLNLFVNYDGNVYPCQNLIHKKFEMFDALDLNQSIVEKIKERSHSVFDELDKINTALIERCIDCRHKLFCGYCLANIDNMFSDISTLESTCKLIRNSKLDI